MTMRIQLIALGVALAVVTASGCATGPVQPPAAAQVDDRVITSTIKARHDESPDVAITDFTVETLYGVVLLTGFARSSLEKENAQRLAEQVKGVKSVRNEIRVQTQP